MNQVTLQVLNPQVLQNHSHLKSYWKSLPQIHHINQVTLPVEIFQPPHITLNERILPVDIHKACHRLPHLTFHQSRLSQLHDLNQMTLPVDIPQDYQHGPHLSCHWSSLYHLQLLIPVFIPVRSPQIFRNHYLLRTQHNKSLGSKLYYH